MAHSEAKFLHILVKNIKKYDHAGNVSWAVYYIKKKKNIKIRLCGDFIINWSVAVFQVKRKIKHL